MTVRLKKSDSQLVGEYYNRFQKLLVSLDAAIIDAGRKTEKQQLIESSEQNDSRRKLLVVEEITNKKKEEAASAQNAFLQEVEADFNKSLIIELETEFRDTPMIMEKILKFNKHIGQLLDILYTEACTISRLVACIELLPWLEQALLKFVRQPKYRRVDSRGHPIKLKTLRSALSFVGIESLRSLIPILIARQAIPIQSEAMPNLAKHIWQYTIGTGNVAKAIAEKYEVRPHFGFNVGLLSNIGRTVVANVYLRTFDTKLREEMIKQIKNNNPVQANALGTLSPSYKYLTPLWDRHANQITSNVVKALNCRWLMIAVGFEDYTNIRQFNIEHVDQLDLHPLAKLLFTSQGFMQYKMLYREKLMEKQDAMMYLRNYGISSSDVANISKVNLSGLELNIAGTIDESDETHE